MLTYSRETLVSQNGIVHLMHRNRGIRVKFFCDRNEGGWRAFSTLRFGHYPYPTCLYCVDDKYMWSRLFREIEWAARSGFQEGACT